MTTAVSIPVAEYLDSTYRPDCDYVNGELGERAVGELGHSAVQEILCAIFRAHREAWKVLAFPELRVQVGPERYRVPDVTVLRRSDPKTPIVKIAPLICIEILSPEDRMQRVSERIADYFLMGVPNVWVIDPDSRTAWVAEQDGSLRREKTAFAVEASPVRVVLEEVFRELDEMQS
jgi:Uma2 family endonuclease